MTQSNDSSTPLSAWAVFVDFDGTITDLDTFDILVKRFAGDDAWRRTEIGLDDGSMSLRDVLQLQASYVRGTFAEVATILRAEIAIDPTFAAFVASCRRRGIPVTIVSSGIAPIIRDRLDDIGLGDLPIVANEIDMAPGGWSIRFRDADGNGTDKAAIVRAARESGRRTMFFGDGRSDYAAALEADRCFAKTGLALERYLRERNVPFAAFASFGEIDLDRVIGRTTKSATGP
jgi:2-hydroxy-3-keto-5-methylthiopentenyl-1-phosphate phosphatase